MPLNFELTFTRPFLLALEQGEITDADTFSEKFAELYEQTINQGAPLGIPPTLPAPSLLGAPAPVGTGPSDAFVRPGSYTSRLRMYRSFARYFVTRELLLAEQDIETSLETLKTIYRKQTFNAKRIQALVAKAAEIRLQLKELPQKLKELAELARDLFTEYKNLLQDIEAEISGGNVDLLDEAAVEDLEIIQLIKNLKISNLQEVRRSVDAVSKYLKKQNVPIKNSTETARVSFVVRQISDLLRAIIDPESFGALIARISSDKVELQTKIERARKSYQEYKQARERYEPALSEIERRIKEAKRVAKERIDSLIRDQKLKIQQKQSNKLKTKQRAEKKRLFQKAAEDVKEFKKENAELVKQLRVRQKTLTQILKKSNEIVRGVLVVKDDLIKNEIPTIKREIVEAYGAVTGSAIDASAALNVAQRNLKTTAESLKSTTISDLGIERSEGGYTTDKTAIKTYFNSLGLDLIAEPLMKVGLDAKITYQDFRKIVETKQPKYEQYKTILVSFKTKFYEIIELAKTLDDPLPPPSFIKQDPYTKLQREIQKEKNRQQRIANRKAFAEKVIKAKPTQSIISLMQEIQKFTQEIKSWMNKQMEKVKAFAKKTARALDAIADKIVQATLNILPIPTKRADARTKQEAAKEKADKIKEYRAKLKKLRQQGEALALVGRAIGPLTSNIGSGKLKASENEKHLKNIAEGIFKFRTVGLDPDKDSIAYGAAELDKKKFLEIVEVLKSVEQLITLVLTVFRDIKASGGVKAKAKQTFNDAVESGIEFGRGFVEDLKLTALRINQDLGRQTSGGYGITKQVASNKLVSIFVDLFSQDPSYQSVTSNIKRIKTELQGEALSSLLTSVSFTQALIDLEKKYLGQTQQVLHGIIGALQEQEQTSSADEAQPLTEAARIANESKKESRQKLNEARAVVRGFSIGGFNLYEELVQLNKLISKNQGSFLCALIDKLIVLTNEFEAKIKRNAIQWLKGKQDDIKKMTAKYAEEHEEQLAKIKQKLANAEALVLTGLCGTSARLYWAGAKWQNSVGTTFVVTNIGRFPRLKKNGLVDGGEEYIREVAQNFQKQLSKMSGFVLPNPSTGIPPFPFKGYG